MIDTKAIRSKILDLAIRGKLTDQLPEDGTAEELYQQIQEEKQALIKSGKIKKEKPLPEIAEDEIPFEIPDSWKWVRLRLLSNQITDGTHKTPTYVKEGIPFLSVKNISAGCLDLTDIKFIPQNEHEELIKRCRPEKNDILFCRIGTLGRALRIDTDLEFSIFVSLGLIKTDNEELSNHIVYVINSEYGSNWIQSVKAGGAMHAYKINLTDLNMFPIPLPPFAELGRIAEKIEQAFSVLDTIDELQAKYADNLTVLKSKLIDLAIRGKLTEQLPEDGTAEELYQQIQEEKQALIKSGKIKKEKPLPEIAEDEIPFEIPDNWKWVRLGKLISIESGRNLTAAEMKPGGTPVYGGNGITGYHNCGFVPEGTVVIGRVGYYCGSVHVTKAESWITDNAFITTYPDNYIEKWYLVYSLRQMKLGQNNNGAAQPVVSGKKIYPLVFPLPPLAEQKRIVERLDKILAVCDEMK